MDSAQPKPEAAASSAPHAAHTDAVPLNSTTATTASSVASDASVASPAAVAALANDLAYTLTVAQTRELFVAHNRKVPAERTIQNYCIEGNIAAQKIRTTYGSEWLINERSLQNFIQGQPVLATATTASHAPQATHTDAVPLNSATATTASSVASDASVARFAEVAPIGERRNIADVLIENARLLAVSEGKDRIIDEKNEQISELRDDRAFLRDEIREARRNRDDVKNIAERMLDTLKSMALGRLGMTDVTTSAPEHRQSTTVNPGSQS